MSKEYFEEIANQWDTMRQDFFSEVVREKAYQMANVETGKTAADIGAGTGFISEGLLKRGLHVIAVDQAEAMQQQTKEKFREYDTIDYRVGDAESLPIEDNSVDYVFANMFLHHIKDPILAIKEMVRIVRPSGKVVISDLDTHTFEFLKTEQFDEWMGFDRVQIAKWFYDAGLKDVHIDCAGGDCCSSSGCGEEAKISIFVAIGVK